MEELRVFTGNAHPALAQAITEYLNIPLGKCDVFQFSNENTFVRILENVRERDTFVVQPFSSPVNNNLVELLIMIDALKRASAGRITAVVPYYGYGRSDRKDQQAQEHAWCQRSTPSPFPCPQRRPSAAVRWRRTAAGA